MFEGAWATGIGQNATAFAKCAPRPAARFTVAATDPLGPPDRLTLPFSKSA